MKAKLFISSLLLFFFIGTGSLFAQIPTNGMVAYWPFNGNANDESGNGNNGTVYGATLVNDRFGHPNSAYTFDGINDFIRINTQPSLRPPVISFSCWVNFISCPSWGVLFDNLSGDPWNGFEIEYASVLQQQIIFEFYTSIHSGVSSLATLDLNKWYHFVITYDGSLIKIYLNGVKVNEKATSGNLNYTNTVNATFGSRFNGTDAFFNGLLDDARMYDHAINQQEIDALYHEGELIQTPGSTCSLALPQPSTGINTNLQISDTSLWLSFIADTTALNLSIQAPSDTPAANIRSLALYNGNCGGLQQLVRKSKDAGESLAIIKNDMVVGDLYFIEAKQSTAISGNFNLDIKKIKPMAYCLNSLEINTSLADNPYTFNMADTTLWLSFIANNNSLIIQKNLSYYFNYKISIYKGVCDNLILLLQTDSNNISYHLNIGNQYFIKLSKLSTTNENIGLTLRSKDALDCTPITSGCELIRQGGFEEFSANACDPNNWNSWDPFELMNTTCWINYNQSPQIVCDNLIEGSRSALMWAGYGNRTSECIAQFVNIEANKNYLLSYKIKRRLMGTVTPDNQSNDASLDDFKVFMGNADAFINPAFILSESTSTLIDSRHNFNTFDYTEQRKICFSTTAADAYNFIYLYPEKSITAEFAYVEVDEVHLIPLELPDKNFTCNTGQLGFTCDISSYLGSDFDISWDLPQYLNNPNILNPTVSGLTQTTIFTATLTYHDPQGGVHSCSFPQKVIVTNPLIVNVSSNNGNHCSGQLEGLTAAITNGTSPFTYLWSTGATSSSINVSLTVSTTYKVTVTDASGCSANGSLLVTVNPTPVITATPVNQFFCGTSNISISLTSTVPNVDYTWLVAFNNLQGTSDGQTNQSFIYQPSLVPTGIGTAIYSINSGSNFGCPGNPVTAYVTVTQIPVVTATPASATICSGTGPSIALTSVTATTFDWTVLQNNVTGASAGSGSNINQILSYTGTASGTASYSITPTLNSCSGSVKTVVITVKPTPVAIATPAAQTICSNTATSIALSSAVAGTTFTWTIVAQPGITGASAGNGTNIAQILSNSGTTAGTATYTITPFANGCSGTPINVVITVNPNPIVTATPLTQTICGNTSVNINLGSNVNGTIINWTSTASNVTGSTSGSGNAISDIVSTSNNGSVVYNITSSANGCPGNSIIANVMVNSALAASFTQQGNLKCNQLDNPPSSGSIRAIVSSGHPNYTYAWSTGTTVTSSFSSNLKTGLPPGPISVTITDINGCYTILSATIAQPPPIIATITGKNSCYNQSTGAADLSVTGGTPGSFPTYTYNWSNSATTEDISNLSQGTYIVTIHDANNCTKTASVTIIEPASFMAVIATNPPVANPLCYNYHGSATVVALGGVPPLSYLWSNGMTVPNPNNLLAGLNTVSIHDANNCTASTSVTLTQPAQLTAAITVINTDNTCCNASATVNANGGTQPYTYNWSNSSANQTTQQATNLCGSPIPTSVTVSDAHNCNNTQYVTISNSLTGFTHPNGAIITPGPAVTWPPSQGYKINGTIIVKQGATLYLTNSTLQFNINSGIIVEAGGKLLLSGSHLTNISGCSKMWNGIYVYGNPNADQSTTGLLTQNIHGYVSVLGSIIENAKVGINSGSVTNESNGGGIIITRTVTNPTIFKNNRVGINFKYYNKVNVSDIEATFICDAPLIDPMYNGEGTSQFISISGGINSYGYNIKGCTFKNLISNAPIDKRGTGIFIKGTARLGPNSLFLCTFENLTYGIYGSLKNTRIYLNTFTNVRKGIYLISSNGVDLSPALSPSPQTPNVFTIPVAQQIQGGSTYGIYAVAPNNLNISKCQFYGASLDQATDTLSYGVIISNSGKIANNTVFQNQFRSTSIGIQTQGTNDKLKIRCNTFAEAGYKHAKAAWTSLMLPPSYTVGTLGTQGDPACAQNSALAAGNMWQETTAGSEIDVKIDINHAVYFKYYANPIDQFNGMTTLANNSTLAWRNNPIWFSSSCLAAANDGSSCSNAKSNLTISPDVNLQGFINEANTAMANINTEKTNLIQTINNGNSQILVNDIHNDLPAGNVKNELMNASPYLSDRVLLASLNEKPSPLPAGHIKLVVVANSPVTNPVKTAIDNRTDIPNGIKQQINNAQTGVSQRFIAERRLVQLDAEMVEVEKALVDAYLNIGNTIDAIAVLEESVLPESKKILAELLMSSGNTTSSRSALAEVIQLSTPEILPENQNYVSLMNVLLNLQDSGLSVYDMTALQEQIIRSIASSGTPVAVQAEVILTQVFGDVFDHPIAVASTNALKSLNDVNNGANNDLQQQVPNLNDHGIFAKIYPNPNNGKMELFYNLSADQNGRLLLFDITGKQLLNLSFNPDKNIIPLSLETLANGLYFYRVYSGNEIIADEKLVIIK